MCRYGGEEALEAIQASPSEPPSSRKTLELTLPASSTSPSSRLTPRLAEMQQGSLNWLRLWLWKRLTEMQQGSLNRQVAVAALSGLLALLVIGVSILIYYTAVYVPHQLQVQATAVAQTVTSLTATAQAQATATASSPQGIYTLATSGTLALNESLSSQSDSQWDEYPPTNGFGCQFSAGAYHAFASRQYSFERCLAEASTFGDFAFQVQMTILKGDGGGLVFRDANTTNCQEYVFFVNQDGSYNFSVYTGCPGSDEQNLLKSSSVYFNTGLNQSNQITVIARQHTFYFYANRQYLESFTDATYTTGKIGVIAHDDTHPTEVVYTNAEVWQL